MRKVYLTIFGETKCIKEWSEDPRCKVHKECLYKRTKDGWEHEKALTYLSTTDKEYLTGKRFGRLLVVGPSERKPIRGERFWECVCDCGKKKTSCTGRLVCGGIKSCGCLRSELSAKKFRANYLGYSISSQNSLFSSYKREAKSRKLEWGLDKDYFLILTKQNCYYCHCVPKKVFNKGNSGDYIYNGVDRVDTKAGYTKENSVSCCEQCNIMKFDYTTDEFLSKVRDIYFHNLELINKLIKN